MAEDFNITLRSDPRLLCALRWMIRAYVSSFGLDAVVDEVVLAVDEACANAIRHSYGGDQNRPLTLLLRAQEVYIEIELRDEGLPIPPERVHPPALEQVESERMTPGGLGMHLIHQIFDEVSYEPGTERGNRVIMRLHRARAAGKTECH